MTACRMYLKIGMTISILCYISFMLVGISIAVAETERADEIVDDRVDLVIREISTVGYQHKALRLERARSLAEHILSIESSLLDILSYSDPSREDRGQLHEPYNLAVLLLGSLRSAEAIPHLLERIQPSPDVLMWDQSAPLSPVEHALISIGHPVVAPLFERIKEGPVYPESENKVSTIAFYYHSAEVVLAGILGREDSKNAINSEIENTRNTKYALHLRQVLRLTESRLENNEPVWIPTRFMGRADNLVRQRR